MRFPAPEQSDVATALGQLIIGAIEHLTARPCCCPDCCPHCAALRFYYDELPIVADTAIAKAATQQFDWRMPEDGTINWPYLIKFWDAIPDTHKPICGGDPGMAIT